MFIERCIYTHIQSREMNENDSLTASKHKRFETVWFDSSLSSAIFFLQASSFYHDIFLAISESSHFYSPFWVLQCATLSIPSFWHSDVHCFVTDTLISSKVCLKKNATPPTPEIRPKKTPRSHIFCAGTFS